MRTDGQVGRELPHLSGIPPCEMPLRERGRKRAEAIPTMKRGRPDTTRDCMGAKERAGLATQGGATPTIGEEGGSPLDKPTWCSALQNTGGRDRSQASYT
jgi:hypothetical protein